MVASLLSALVFPDLDPVALRLGPLVVRWYGLTYLLAFACAYFALRVMSRRQRLRVSVDQLHGLVLAIAAGVVIGGRAGWWFFYHRAIGAEPWYEPFAIWHGGMSFHGGLVGVAAAALLWTRWHRAPFWNVADSLALVAPAGLFFGRLANFVNAELVGRRTDVPWGVVFPGDTFARHPSQLYEAVTEGLLLLVVLSFLTARRAPREGQVAAYFLLLYGTIRFLIEFTREPDEQVGFIVFGWLTMGQLLSLVLLTVGAAIWWVRKWDAGITSPTGATRRRTLP